MVGRGLLDATAWSRGGAVASALSAGWLRAYARAASCASAP